MAENKKSFILYCDILHTVKKLSNEQAGELFKHILSYVNDENPITDNIVVDLVFEPIKQQLKRDLRHWESVADKRKESGKIGGLKSGEVRKNEANEANASKLKQTKQNEANEAVTVNVNDTVNVNEIDKSKIDQNGSLDITKFVSNFEGLDKETIKKRQIKIWTAIFESDYWIEKNAACLKITIPQVKRLLEDFLKTIFAKDESYKPLSEIKRYFLNWAKLQLQKQL